MPTTSPAAAAVKPPATSANKNSAPVRARTLTGASRQKGFTGPERSVIAAEVCAPTAMNPAWPRGASRQSSMADQIKTDRQNDIDADIGDDDEIVGIDPAGKQRHHRAADEGGEQRDL